MPFESRQMICPEHLQPKLALTACCGASTNWCAPAGGRAYVRQCQGEVLTADRETFGALATAVPCSREARQTMAGQGICASFLSCTQMPAGYKMVCLTVETEKKPLVLEAWFSSVFLRHRSVTVHHTVRFVVPYRIRLPTQKNFPRSDELHLLRNRSCRTRSTCSKRTFISWSILCGEDDSPK